MGAGGPDPLPTENHKNIGFQSNTAPDPLTKIVSEYDQTIPQSQTADEPGIHCWVIIGTPLKRHFNGVSLAGR